MHTDAHHIPAALQPPRTAPQPIPFPSRPANARTSSPSDSTRSRWAQMERVSQAIEAARSEGRAEGVRHGYRQGWRWGLCCGLAAGALAASVAWGAYLARVVPGVAG